MGAMYGRPADVFSFGLVIGEVMSRVKPSKYHLKRQRPYFTIDPVEFRRLAPADCPREVCCCHDDVIVSLLTLELHAVLMIQQIDPYLLILWRC